MADYWVAQRTDYWAVRRAAATRDEEVFGARQAAFDRARELVMTSGGGDVIAQDLEGRVTRTAVRSPTGDPSIIRHRRFVPKRTTPAGRAT